MRPRIPLLLGLPHMAPAQAWRLVASLYAQPQSLVQGSVALVAVHALCLVRTGWHGFLLCAAASLAVMALRLLHYMRYWRGREAGTATDDTHGPRYWAAHFAAGASATAFVWGATDLIVLLKFNDAPLQIFVLMVQAGWLGGAGVRNAASPVAVTGQAMFTMLPGLIGVLLAQDRFVLAAAPFIVVHFAATLGITRYLGGQLVASMGAEQRLADANAQLVLLSATDGLTGIGNRRAFDAALQVEWARAAREALDLAILMVDVDFFKSYNDHYGHLAGDDCLRAVALLVQGSLRRPPDLAARFGGEEFASLLPATSEAGGRDVAERLRLAVENAALPHATSPLGILTVSIGVASMAPQPGQDPTALIGLSDRALYDAKQAGRNRVRGATDLLKLGPWHRLAPSPAADAACLPIPHGIEVLVLEDDEMVAALLADMLTDLGCVVRGPCHKVEAALALIDTRAPRIALLDLYVGRGTNCYAVADALAAHGIPFAFVTADGGADLRPDLASRRLLQKPFRFPMLARLVGDLAREVATQAKD